MQESNQIIKLLNNENTTLKIFLINQLIEQN